MRREYKVRPLKAGWEVRRGSTEPLTFKSRDAALRAARTLAQGATQAGDIGVVTLDEGEGAAVAVYEPDLPRHSLGARFDPERDNTERSARRSVERP